MPVYAKRVKTTDPRFCSRETVLLGTDLSSGYRRIATARIPIPDSVVLCNGCNSNVAETEKKEGYLIYLNKRELKADRPYDFYCEQCAIRYFPKAIHEGG